MTLVSIIGLLASVLTAVCMLPQLVKIIRERKSEEISYLMLTILIAGVALWVVYGVMKEDWFIVASNAFSLLVNASVLVLSFKYWK